MYNNRPPLFHHSREPGERRLPKAHGTGQVGTGEQKTWAKKSEGQTDFPFPHYLPLGLRGRGQGQQPPQGTEESYLHVMLAKFIAQIGLVIHKTKGRQWSPEGRRYRKAKLSETRREVLCAVFVLRVEFQQTRN